ncbi:MAG: hypothetical protein IJ131_08280 [Eggerthellaceae bacterium]|nr:hypothetical protein [Eggerthellaceae bacterium]
MGEKNESVETIELNDFDERLKSLDDAERAIDDAFHTGRAERSKITQMAQLDAADAVAMAGVAMESDVEADEAMRISVIAEKSGDRERAKVARKKEREARKKAKADHAAATKSAKRAYDAIKYSAPNKMGFMRAVQVIFAIHIAGSLIWLMLTSRDSMNYNVTTIMDWIMVILEGVAFWMFINRYKVARPLVIGMAILGIVVAGVVDAVSGNFNPFTLAFNNLFYVFLILYFALSRRVKATSVNDLSMRKGDYDKEDFVVNRRGWPFVRNLIIYFIVFSILGHWMEMGMCQFIILGLVEGEYDPSNTMLWRDWLYPFPMEGAAVVVIALVLYPFYLWLKKKFKKNVIIAYIISFIAGALLCSFIEFTMGLLVNANYELWDYRDNFGNIMGQICLQNTLAFGVVAAIITWWVYPMLERMIARVPNDVMNIVFVVIAVFGAIIWSLYLINPPGVDDANLPENKDQPEIVQKDYETRLVATRLANVEQSIDSLEAALNESSELDKEELKAKIEAIRVATKSMLNDGLGLDEYPGLYDQFIAEVVESGSSSSSSAGGSGASSSNAA